MSVKSYLFLSCALFTCLASPLIAQQPVLRYTFDEASGNAIDTGSGTASDGAFVDGATRSTDTPSGSGMSLDLRTDNPYAYVEAADSPEFDGFAQLTLTTWIKVETYPDAGSGNKRIIAKQAANATFSGFSFNMNATTNNLEPASPDNFRLGLFLGSDLEFGAAFSDADVAGASEWTFLATTYDSSTFEVKFYTGGIDTPVTQLGSTVDPGVGAMPLDSDARFAIGLTDAATAADTSVTGLQDDVRVYSAALDLAALEAIRMENLGGGGGGLAADFNGDDVVNVADFTAWRGGFGTTGTATKSQGDADGDMDADGADLLVWQQQTGMSNPSAASVPEPTGAALLVGFAVVAVTRRRRRR